MRVDQGVTSELELTMASVCARTLRVAEIGPDEDVFDLGASSLAVLELTAAVRETFGVELAVADVFDHPTPAELAARVRERLGAGDGGPSLPQLERVAREGRHPLDPSQASRLEWEAWAVENAVLVNPNTSAIAFRLRGRLDEAALEGALQALVDRHEPLRTSFRLDGGRWYQTVAPARVQELRRIELRGADDAEVAALLAGLWREPLAKESGELLHAVSADLGGDEHVVYLGFDHLVSDNWSMRVVARDLSELYAARLEGRAPDLPQLLYHHLDWVHWQERRLADGELERLLERWTSLLGDGPALPDLGIPPELAERTEADRWGATAVVEAAPELGPLVGSFAAASAVTPYMVTLTAFAALLAERSGHTDVRVNTQVARRPFPELYDAVGCFINSVLVRADVEGEPSFAELLGRVRSFALAAYAHQDMPYVHLIEALEPLHYRRARRPQILFDYYHHRQLAEADDELRLPGLEVEPVPVPARSAPINAFNFSVLERRDGSLAAHLSFAREEERELFESLACDFHRTLAAGIAAPETRVSKLVPEPAQ